ncbi:MAG: HlyD family efflux transporter periplasmic adaptor subunit [Rubinisphaera brasiliensis]|uniref:HlyD family efflux transporter periplasmic adaptor subunit n=1 Tax=Rubinisphaera brasiliensis TaxID=119 RepID=UPI00391BD497
MLLTRFRLVALRPAAVLAFGIFFSLASDSRLSAQPSSIHPLFKLPGPTASDLNVDAELFRLSPTRTATVTAPTNGTVSKFPWRLGDQVKGGEVILVLESERLRLELERALGNFHRTYLSLQASQASGKEPAEEEQEINSLAQRAAVSELREVFHKIQRLTVTAPFSGRIEQVYANPGELLRSGQPLLRLIETNYGQLRIPVDTRHVVVGQKVCLLFSEGRKSGTIIDVLPESAETKPYADLLERPGVAVVLVSNQPGLLETGTLGYVPAHPFALLPKDYLSKLDKNSPVVTVQKGEEPFAELPVEIIGSAGPVTPDYTLVVGPFQDGEVLVEVVTPATADVPAVTKPIESAIIFPRADPLMTTEQFEARFPALADRVIKLMLTSLGEDGNAGDISEAVVPRGLEGILFPLEYPLAAADPETLLKRWGMDRRNLPIVDVVRSYFLQEINRKRLAVRTIDEVKYATSSGSLKDYVDAVEAINDEFLAVLLAVAEMDDETLFGRLLTAYGAEAILEQPGPQLLNLTPEQAEQVERMQEGFEQQRQVLFEQYLRGNLPADQYRATSQQALDAWRQDLALVLTPEQRERLAELTPAAAIPSEKEMDETQPSTSGNSSAEAGDQANEEDDEAPTRRLVIPELKQESAMLPFLILGGGVVVVLLLLIVGYVIYRKRSS